MQKDFNREHCNRELFDPILFNFVVAPDKQGARSPKVYAILVPLTIQILDTKSTMNNGKL